MKWLHWLYGIRDAEIVSPDLVVALGYGLNCDGSLPDATKKVLQVATEIAQRYNIPIVWASSKYIYPGSEEAEDKAKMEFVKTIGATAVVKCGGITNSVTEAEAVRRLVGTGLIAAKSIVIVLDWPHARSAKLIYEKTFPNSRILVKNVEGEWNDSHMCVFQKSFFRWFLACVLRHLALLILGLERVAKIQHPIAEK